MQQGRGEGQKNAGAVLPECEAIKRNKETRRTDIDDVCATLGTVVDIGCEGDIYGMPVLLGPGFGGTEG